MYLCSQYTLQAVFFTWKCFCVKVLDRRLFHEYGITLSRNSLRSTVSCLQREVCVTVCWIKQRCRVWELAVIKWTPPEMRILN
ncbi:hypothetical protein AAZX31_12G084900 [Glycine max]|uniref:Uncharacterized protein n=2 Tax=Glycine subgen. Soja TaxID=1462606 RepID=A0A0R0H3L6_SOYBN|nr:hypothetical protein GYH30_033138 [Glycine max]KRH25229.1 hypothetical protein GLYMA_12G088800v4 [Glycine max]RZB75015.1 hypothetical protein D0Y65_033773 [Glycine soja]